MHLSTGHAYTFTSSEGAKFDGVPFFELLESESDIVSLPTPLYT